MTTLDVRLRWSLKGGGCLLEASLIAMNQSGFWLGGGLREVVAQGGSTVLSFFNVPDLVDHL